jgi:nitrate reductase gamma subunit
MAQLDLDELSQRYRLSIEPQEDPTERAHRHRQEWLATVIGRGLHVLLVLFAIGMVGLLVWYCLGILTGYVSVSGASPAVTAEAQKWAMVILSAIAAGLIGFLTGKAVK